MDLPTVQHNEAKPVNESLLRHEPCVCDGMCICHTVDLDYKIPIPVLPQLFVKYSLHWAKGGHCQDENRKGTPPKC